MKLFKQFSKFTFYQILIYFTALGYFWYIADVLRVPAILTAGTWGIVGFGIRWFVNKYLIFNEEKK